MDLKQCFLTASDCYRSGKAIRPTGVMVHSTGANNPSLSRYVAPGDARLGEPSPRHWNQAGLHACVHAFIGKLLDGSVATYQTLPWTMRGWHCGGGGNNTHISFEICEDDLTHGDYFQQVYQEAVELTAHLCKEFELDPAADGIVICHAEGHQRGIATNHADVMHWFVRYGKSMDDFRADVAQKLRPTKEVEELTQEQIIAIVRQELTSLEAQRSKQPADQWAQAGLEQAIAKKITDGTRPKSFATRQEVALMVNAAIQVVG